MINQYSCITNCLDYEERIRVSYMDSTFGATSSFDANWTPEEAFSSTSSRGWHSGRGAPLPQQVFVTFPKKRSIAKISFMPPRNCVERLKEKGITGAPEEYEIWATNDVIPKNGLNDGLSNNIAWDVLASVKGVKWDGCDSVSGVEIPQKERKAYFSYAIAVRKSDRFSYASLARVRMWEAIQGYCPN